MGLTSNDNLSTEKVVVLCAQGRKNPFLLCVLIPGSVESQSLGMELEVKEDVEISVIGSQKVSLSGYFHSGHDICTVSKDKSYPIDGFYLSFYRS